MVKQYDGILGVFEYDDEEYEIDKNDGYLRYILHSFNAVKPTQLIGCINFNFLFNGRINIEIFDLSSWEFNDDINTEHMFDGLKSDINLIINESFFSEDNDKLQEQFNSLSNLKLFLVNSRRSKIIEISRNGRHSITSENLRNVIISYKDMVENPPSPIGNINFDQTISILPDNDFSGDTMGSFFTAEMVRDTSIKSSGSGYKRPRKNQKHYF